VTENQHFNLTGSCQSGRVIIMVLKLYKIQLIPCAPACIY